MTAVNPLLQVEDLKVEFDTFGGVVKAVRGVSFVVYPGETLAIVGESGCGKSVTCQALMGLVPSPPGRVVAGRALLSGRDIMCLSQSDMRNIRGKELSMIFQDPLTSLNPTMKVGPQIAEVITKHRGLSHKDALQEAVHIMEMAQIPEARKRAVQYPHEFSGGMRQRVMIAIALACRPKVLIADEPTTALDVTIQGQILNLLRELQNEINMAVILITHDLGVVASVADRVAVMYAGKIVESGSVDEVFYQPAHPYTVGLQEAIPNPLSETSQVLRAIPGAPPDLFSPPKGCAFYARCSSAMKVCASNEPPSFDFHRYQPEVTRGPRYASCWLHHQNCPEDSRALLHSKQSRPIEVHDG